MPGTPRTVGRWLRDPSLVLDCPDRAAPRRTDERIGDRCVGLYNSRDRRPVAVVVTADGRRVHVPLTDASLVDVSFFGLLRSLLLGLDGLLGLITGSRRENGGSRRTER
ncbi:MAG: hypothetical protein ACYDB6_01075 [Candidatus Limnocylindrales bacterium]